MSDLPTPKYKLGQTVWLAFTVSTKGMHDCPDCLGAKVWSLESPAGLKTTTPCIRCCGGHFSNDRSIPPLSYEKKVASTRPLTIGSIE
ncbi:MAG TPA: hypothetical protein VMV54_06090, partial [Acidocella sp.]|nr:hypothetical protein [Acidocella sp.]